MTLKTIHLDVPDSDWHFSIKKFDVVLFASTGRWQAKDPLTSAVALARIPLYSFDQPELLSASAGS